MRDRPAPIPRATEPADPVLAKAVAELRRDAPEWDWATRVVNMIEAQGAELAELRPLGQAVRSARRAAWGGAGTALVAIGTAMWFAIGVARDVGTSDGVARERAARVLEDRAHVDRVDVRVGDIEREHAHIRGQLEAMRALFRRQPQE